MLTTLSRVDSLSILKGRNSREFLAAAFACYQDRCPFAIARPDTDVAELVHTEHVDSGDDAATRGWCDLSYTPWFDDAPAQVVFTSGTEGKPKPIVLSHRNLADVVTRLNDMMQPTPEIREYVGVPVTYSFGIGRARAVAAAGGRIFIPERFDPLEIAAMLESGDINAISAVPSLWRVVLGNPGIMDGVGEQVRWIEIGSQYMAGEEKAALKRLFPNARIVQHYGLTEASRTTLLDISETEGERLESVGRAVGTTAVRIDEGAVVIRGDHVALGTLQPGGAITPLTDADGWLRTKDEGRLDDGWLYYEGRLDDQINIGGLKLNAETLETAIVQLVPGAAGCFAVGPMPDTARGQIAAVVVERASQHLVPVILGAAETAFAAKGIDPRGSIRIAVADALPLTGTGKVQRKRLFELVEKTSAPDATVATDGAAQDDVALTPGEERIAGIWKSVFPVERIRPQDSLYTLGVDSLTSLQIAMTMEAKSLPKPVVRATLRGESLSEVASRIEDVDADVSQSLALPERTQEIWSVNALRGIMILSIMLSHWGPGVIERLGIQNFLEPILTPIYTMGTEGFATAFGVSVGASLLPQLRMNRATVLKRMRFSGMLVLLGLTLSASISLLDQGLSGEISPRALGTSFYGVLAFYAVILVFAPLWMPLLGRQVKQPATVVLIAVISCLLGRMMHALMGYEQYDSPLEWLRLMAGAGGYNVFDLFALVCVGTVVGGHLHSTGPRTSTAKVFVAVGLALLLSAALAGVDAYGPTTLASRSNQFYRDFTASVFFSGAAISLLGGCLIACSNYEKLHTGTRLILRILIVLGALALPIYVFHGLVIPVKDLLMLVGFSNPISLTLPLAAFLVAFSFGATRLYRSYF